jgi:pyridoxine kinase
MQNAPGTLAPASVLGEVVVEFGLAGRRRFVAVDEKEAGFLCFMNILSVQSHVAYGHVGNAAAVFPLQRIGIDVWPINTVQFSNHPGYGAWTGESFSGAHVRDVMRGLSDRGALARCDGVLSGYMGSPEMGLAIVEAVAAVKHANAAALYCCDPVIGDAGRRYVNEGVGELIREKAVPAADIITPNHYELEFLSSQKLSTLADVCAAVTVLHRRGPRIVLVTSLAAAEMPQDVIDLLVSCSDGLFLLRTPRLPINVNGAGDAIAALFFAHILRGGSAAQALSRAASSVFGVLSRTAKAGERELMLVAAQDELVSPSRIFEPTRICG